MDELAALITDLKKERGLYSFQKKRASFLGDGLHRRNLVIMKKANTNKKIAHKKLVLNANFCGHFSLFISSILHCPLLYQQKLPVHRRLMEPTKRPSNG